MPRRPTVWIGRKALFLSLIVALLAPASQALAQAKSPPMAAIVLGPRDGRATPHHFGYSATGGGTIAVTQPAPDTLVVTMTGVAGAGACACGMSHAGLEFVLDQEFSIEFAPSGPQTGELVIEARATGLLRSEGGRGGGMAEMGRAVAFVACAGEPIATLALDPQVSACGEGVAVTTARGPVTVPVVAGCYNLHEEFAISATQPKCLLPRKASADFAPPPTLESRWISTPDPFREANRSSNGYQVTIRVIPGPPALPAAIPPGPVTP